MSSWAKGDLKEGCIQKALEIVNDSGLEHLSLREVARRLDVSHQAPYKHFTNRDHILAEAIGRAYDLLTAALMAREQNNDVKMNLGEIGRIYLKFANDHPLLYRLMFEMPVPQLSKFEGIEAKAAVSFEILLKEVGNLTQSGSDQFNRECALFAWSTVHGMASLVANKALSAAGFFTSDERETAIESGLLMICASIEARSHNFAQHLGT